MGAGAISDGLAEMFAGRHRLIATTWLGRSGRFGNADRNTVQELGFANLDLSFLPSFALTEKKTLQFRAEYFNMADHATFTVPVSDLNSGNFGRVLEAGPSRLFQLASKGVF